MANGQAAGRRRPKGGSVAIRKKKHFPASREAQNLNLPPRSWSEGLLNGGMPILELHKTFRFESAHFLPHVPDDHKCRRVHGHSFQVVVHVRGPVDTEKGWVVDYADVEKAWAPLHAMLDHRLLNEVPGLENPTSEMLALWLLERFHVEGAKVHAIRVEETCRSACTVYADLDDDNHG